MKKLSFLMLSLVLVFVVITAASGGTTVEAAAKKEFLEISKNVVYYGQLKNGKPHGKGTMSWYQSKTYSGDWVDGKRSGLGKFVSSSSDGIKITYDGAWKNDQKAGNGSLNTKITNSLGVVQSHKIQFGQFANDRFTAGYSVLHVKDDPAYSFNYKDAKMNLQLLGTNVKMKETWKNGKFHTIQYMKGKVIKHYSVTFDENPSLVKQNKATLKYLQGLQTQINPYLIKFESLSKRVPLA
ncbi:hypothetical protein [Bacillus sp. FJAT-28004]|uniref:hypothetical protein n=1 Tax=Bacillus sp. FJAT-28004 TaxID=1679165 RepID=UPI0006B48EBD|nr:hypothetical protein [Bacillus sp. FJAT-28004]